MATPRTELPALASPGATAVPPATDEVEYPEGHWIAQSVAHGVTVRQAAAALDLHFRDRSEVLVAMELMVYYQMGNNAAKLQPDVQVVFGVGRGNRSSYRVWEEGKPPDFVLEVASPSTTGTDARHKAREYSRIGVREFWRIDPQGALMSSPLEGYVLSGGRFSPAERVAGEGERVYLRSAVLGLELRSERQAAATVLVFRDPATGEEFDGALPEAERRRLAAERDKQALQQRVSAAEREKQALQQRVRAAERAKQAAEREKRAAEQRANVADERARALEENLRALTAQAPPPEGHH